MSQDFFEVLARHTPTDNPQRLDAAARVLSALSQQVALVLDSLEDASARQEILSRFNATVLATLADTDRPRSEALTPELLEWANGLFTDEEVIAGMNEIRQTGGLELKDFIQELEQEAMAHD